MMTQQERDVLATTGNALSAAMDRIQHLELRIDNLDKNAAFLFTLNRTLASRVVALQNTLLAAGVIDQADVEQQHAIATSLTDQLVAEAGLMRHDDDLEEPETKN